MVWSVWVSKVPLLHTSNSVISIFFPGEKTQTRREGIQSVRRECFANGHTISWGGGKSTATTQAGQSACLQISCAGGVQWLALTWGGKELMFITLALLRYCQMCAFLCKWQLLENYAALLCSHIHYSRLLSVDTTFPHMFDKHKYQVHIHFETI